MKKVTNDSSSFWNNVIMTSYCFGTKSQLTHHRFRTKSLFKHHGFEDPSHMTQHRFLEAQSQAIRHRLEQHHKITFFWLVAKPCDFNLNENGC